MASRRATAGGGLGSSPCAVVHRAVADGDRRGDEAVDRRATRSAAATPTTSTMASSGADLVQLDVARVDAVHGALGLGQRR